MPKIDIDYSSTIIYKITCKDDDVKDVYVGHTTNFVQRKHAHKNTTHNERSAHHNSKLYKTIREHGGWDNWKMEIIQFYNCANQYEARVKEQQHYLELKATLNSIEPLKENITVEIKETCIEEPKYKCSECTYMVNNKIQYKKHMVSHKPKNEPVLHECRRCNYICYDKKLYDNHVVSRRHIKLQADNCMDAPENSRKVPVVFSCETCNVQCCKKSDYTRHCKTKKHQDRADGQYKSIDKHVCELCDYKCSKQSILNKHFSTSKHKQNALVKPHDTSSDNMTIERKTSCSSGTFPGYPENAPPDYMIIISQLLNQNNELKNFIMEQTIEHKKETADIIQRIQEQASETKTMVFEIMKDTNRTTVTNNSK